MQMFPYFVTILTGPGWSVPTKRFVREFRSDVGPRPVGTLICALVHAILRSPDIQMKPLTEKCLSILSPS